MHLVNTLIDTNTNKFYIIDFEENKSDHNRGVKVDLANNPDFFFFTGKPAKIVRDKWVSQCRKHYPEVIGWIRELLESKKMISKLNEEMVKRQKQLLNFLVI